MHPGGRQPACQLRDSGLSSGGRQEICRGVSGAAVQQRQRGRRPLPSDPGLHSHLSRHGPRAHGSPCTLGVRIVELLSWRLIDFRLRLRVPTTLAACLASNAGWMHPFLVNVVEYILCNCEVKGVCQRRYLPVWVVMRMQCCCVAPVNCCL
jgi:hypothetical protein